MEKFLRVMTYNIRGCRGLDQDVNLERVVGVIKQMAPDVVALQEVDVNQSRSGFLNQAQMLGHRCGMEWKFFPRLQKGNAEYGLGFLSKHPFEVVKSDDLLPQNRLPHKEKILGVWVKVLWERTPVQIVFTHFLHSPRMRKRLTRTLLSNEWLGALNAKSPFVICGDLNSTFVSTPLRLLKRHVQDAGEIHSGLFNINRYLNKTWPSIFPVFRIDHIFVSKDLFVEHFKSIYTPDSRMASDHLPLIADVKLRHPDNKRRGP